MRLVQSFVRHAVAVTGTARRLAPVAVVIGITGCARLRGPTTATTATTATAATNAHQPALAATVPPIAAPIHTQYVMRYADVVLGAGAPAEPGQVYLVHYTGWLRDGTKFDSSRDRGEPIRFEQGRRRVIPGWDAGFEGMRVGGRRRLFIPYQLAYGVRGRGRIPPRAELIFDVELVGVAPAPAADSTRAR